MIEIYAVNQENLIDEKKFNALLKFVSLDRQRRVKKFLKKEDSQKSLIAEVLLRSIIIQKLKIRNDEISFENTKYGKPFLKNFPDFYFNLSHSGKWVVSAFSNNTVGIDIEEIKPIDLAIANRFFSKEEYDFIMSKTEKNRIYTFFDLWTLKESYIKAIGKGFSIPLDNFTILINDDGKISLKNNDYKNYYFKQYEIDINYKMALCRNEIIQNDKLYFLSIDELCGISFE
ncbi:MAG: 4'-phosphopantetheinyl transferase superfamily protein [Desulfobacterales bacterium]|nr:4'-phosphopantetheinyl transferase superfamily protein [Desulfobacterales bacterium]